MPLREYQCLACAMRMERFEVNRDPRDAPSPTHCGCTMTLLAPRSNFALKGEGWPGKAIKAGA